MPCPDSKAEVRLQATICLRPHDGRNDSMTWEMGSNFNSYGTWRIIGSLAERL